METKGFLIFWHLWLGGKRAVFFAPNKVHNALRRLHLETWSRVHRLCKELQLSENDCVSVWERVNVWWWVLGDYGNGAHRVVNDVEEKLETWRKKKAKKKKAAIVFFPAGALRIIPAGETLPDPRRRDAKHPFSYCCFFPWSESTSERIAPTWY